MAYKSLLTVATSTQGLLPVVSAAAQIAISNDAHLDALALGVDRTQVGYSYVGSGAVMIAAAMERAEEEARAAEKALNAAISAQSPGLRVAAESAVTQLGALTDVVAARARYADLVVLPLPYGENRGVEDEAVIEAALFEGMSWFPPRAWPQASRAAWSSPGTKAARRWLPPAAPCRSCAGPKTCRSW